MVPIMNSPVPKCYFNSKQGEINANGSISKQSNDDNTIIRPVPPELG